MRKLTWILVLISLSSFSHSKPPDECPKSIYAISDEKQLIKDLLNNYQNVGIIGRPVSNSFQTVVVKYLLELVQILDLDEKNQVLTINVWKDELLTWNPANYSNVKKIRVPSDRIWTPDIVLYNYADERLKEQRKVMIVVENNGEILWMPPAIYKSSCKIDIKNFPFDEQGCHLKFGSWTYDGTQLDFQFLNNQTEINTEVYTESNEWEIIAKPGKRTENFYLCCPEPYPDITFYLFLRRNPAFFTYLLLLPCVLLSSLTLVIFWLPPESPAKMVLGFYYCLNMILITMSTFCSVIVINLYFRGDNKTRVPSWLKKITVKVGCVLLMDTSNVTEKKEKIKIIKSEIKYNRKYSKKVGFEFKSNQNNYGHQNELGDDQEIVEKHHNTDQLINRNSRLFNDQQCDFELQTHQPDYPKPDINVSRARNNYTTGSDLHDIFYYNNRHGCVRYCLKDNGITITEDPERGINFSQPISSGNQLVITKPKLKNVILTFSQSLENDVTEIRKGMRTLMNRMADIDIANKRASEWRTVALVLDRIFFWIFLSTIIISGLILLLPKGPKLTIADRIRIITPDPINATDVK